MKVTVTDAELAELNKRVYTVGFQAFLASTAAATAGLYTLNRSNAWFKALRPSFKAAAWICPIVVVTVVAAEEQVIQMEKERHVLYDEGGVKLESDKNRSITAQDWPTWLADNRFSLVAAAWVAGVAGSLTFSYSNPYLTPTVKAFHARVQSQAITLAALVAAGAVAPFGSKTSIKADHDMFQRRLEYEEKKWTVEHPGESTHKKH
ncbi:hypothetical protein SARC_00710 [Sphaeroforma arctica JP610]|uniref:HIG1 domain-containing protein n=1 Tax=Sphaeroforma arctica JP610 TaxID=667725 RepID=A0A0L0GDT9_9EUKA|nr:hypothetical protein SARC_00710 [Sphaeroforma arctica JP610]KNC87182.1 hypothetical protein SARC_00710 [Sphaeroforma arctica JP610]|eukprot:XP_014161084.1 hypothetical protein SARC_00710 [Sphaeroforma arctica JP610]